MAITNFLLLLASQNWEASDNNYLRPNGTQVSITV